MVTPPLTPAPPPGAPASRLPFVRLAEQIDKATPQFARSSLVIFILVLAVVLLVHMSVKLVQIHSTLKMLLRASP